MEAAGNSGKKAWGGDGHQRGLWGKVPLGNARGYCPGGLVRRTGAAIGLTNSAAEVAVLVKCTDEAEGHRQNDADGDQEPLRTLWTSRATHQTPQVPRKAYTRATRRDRCSATA